MIRKLTFDILTGLIPLSAQRRSSAIATSETLRNCVKTVVRIRSFKDDVLLTGRYVPHRRIINIVKLDHFQKRYMTVIYSDKSL